MKKVLFILPYPLKQAPSQRFRVEAFFSLLQQHRIPYDTHEFLDQDAWDILYKGGSSLQKGLAVVKGFLKRFRKVLFDSRQYDLVFVHREASPLGPPVFEWLLARVLRKKVIFDFDDAIWIPNVTESNKLARSVKCFWKVAYICKWSHKVSAGNRFLAGWSERYNNRVVVNPTCVDVETRFNRLREAPASGKVVIGWTGSHSTLKYLDIIYPVLQRLEKEFDFEFLVICNQPPAFELKSLKFMKWQESTEIDDLIKMDIGVMPLIADAWSEGKCGFKLIQYLSLGIASVASPVGVNRDIVQQGQTGFLCSSEQEWYEALKTLLENPGLRRAMGKAGREKIVGEYSVQSNAANFLSFFS
ncbi:glycosyltransferase [Paraflavisolibacter sp. H34]|uniref:glycosyltransferase n=1 Tax=Huijunlia imazamoxiresistens TaxID=3127457 RepID=UPI003015F4D0